MDAAPSSSSDTAPPPRSRRTGVLSALGAAALALLANAKGLLVLLKGLKLAKLALTMGSMFVMIYYEALRYGWAFGAGFVLLILVHELGHGVAIRRAGL